MATKPLPSQEALRQLLDYDPETGALTWRERGVEWFTEKRQSREHSAAIWNSRHAGTEAFTARSTGYRYGSILGKLALAHRVVWKMHYGVEADHVDHVNGDREDNRIENLRDVSATGNSRNICIPKHNTSGVMGVSFDRSRARWAAYITLADRKHSLGRFDCIGKAIRARRAAERAHGFHQNHGRTAS